MKCVCVCRLVRRLLFFYKPSSKLYGSLELEHPKASQLTAAGCQLINFLLDSEEVRVSDSQRVSEGQRQRDKGRETLRDS